MQEAQVFIAEGVAAGELAPLISRTLPLSDIVTAHRELESGAHVGKLVVIP